MKRTKMLQLYPEAFSPLLKQKMFHLRHFGFGVILLHDGKKYANLDLPVFCSHVHDVWKMRGNLLNVGVDVWHLRPVAFDRALEYWKYRDEYYTRAGRDA